MKSSRTKAKKYIHAALITLLIISISGCGSIVARTARSSVDANYFKGVQGTYQYLTLKASFGPYDPLPIMCLLTIICPVAFIYSLPIDAAIDTVLLPYDLFKS